MLLCRCVLLCTHLWDLVPRFRRHPFLDLGLESVCVCVCVCVCVFVFVCGILVGRGFCSQPVCCGHMRDRRFSGRILRGSDLFVCLCALVWDQFYVSI